MNEQLFREAIEEEKRRVANWKEQFRSLYAVPGDHAQRGRRMTLSEKAEARGDMHSDPELKVQNYIYALLDLDLNLPDEIYDKHYYRLIEKIEEQPRKKEEDE